MLIVGTDRMTVAGIAGTPDGTRHAVDRDGRVLCRDTRPRFAWPALAWEGHRGEEACPLCVQVRTAQQAVEAPAADGALALSAVTAYPDEAPAPTTTAIVPWQPAIGLFQSSDQ